MASPKTGKVLVVLVVVALAAAAAYYGYSRFGKWDPEGKPPVVLVIIDTLPAGHSNAYGYSRSTTTQLSDLAKIGVLYEHAVAASPWTLPSIASILTGMPPYQHQAGIHLDPWTVEDRQLSALKPSVRSMAEDFQERGYMTAGFFNNPFVDPAFGLNRGFDLYDYAPGDNINIRPSVQVVYQAMEWIRNNPDRPFFLVLHFFDPHLAYHPPVDHALPYTANYSGTLRSPFNPVLKDVRSGKLSLSEADKDFIIGLYDAEISSVDFQIGLFFRFLESKNLFDPALIVVTSDHGEEFWEHGGFEHGHSLHREVVEVPLVIKYPGNLYSGERVSGYVSLMDIYPTLMEYLAWPVPAGLGGVSIAPGGGDPPSRAILSMNLHYGPEQQMVIMDGFKMIVNVETGAIKVYELLKDPEETRNVFGEIKLPDSLGKEVRKIAADLKKVQEQGGEAVKLDKETIDKLKSLGYIE